MRECKLCYVVRDLAFLCMVNSLSSILAHSSQCALSLYCRVLLLRQSFRMPIVQNCRRSCRKQQAHYVFCCVYRGIRFQSSEPDNAVASCLFVERSFSVYMVQVKSRWCGWSVFKAFVTLRYKLLACFIYCCFISALLSILLV